MRVLGIESSDRALSLAIVEDEALLASYTSNIKQTHGERLLPEIQHLLRSIGLQANEIDRFAVSQGPGSYTGLRIGVTAAKMFASSLDKDLVGVSSLKALAYNVAGSFRNIVPMIDARRGNVYAACYKSDSGGLKTILPDQHLPLEEWLDVLNDQEGSFVFVKDYEPFKDQILEVLGDRAHFACWRDNLNDAESVARLGAKEDPVDISTFTPTYLKLAEAEEKWQEEHKGKADDSYVEKI